MAIIEWIKCQFNGHWWKHVRNIHGDEIIAFNARSEWFCTKCHSYEYRKYLHYDNKRTD